MKAREIKIVGFALLATVYLSIIPIAAAITLISAYHNTHDKPAPTYSTYKTDLHLNTKNVQPAISGEELQG